MYVKRTSNPYRTRTLSRLARCINHFPRRSIIDVLRPEKAHVNYGKAEHIPSKPQPAATRHARVHNGGGDPRSRMLAQRDAERKRVAARAAPPVANTYEGRQAQQQAYLQSVQMQKQQMQMDEAMRKQATNGNIKPQAYDPNAKAATNRAINETRKCQSVT